jgi:hypothetical protein
MMKEVIRAWLIGLLLIVSMANQAQNKEIVVSRPGR